VHPHLQAFLRAAATGQNPSVDRAMLGAALNAQREVEREQSEQLKRLQTLFNGASVGIARIDRVGHAYEANATAQQMLGYTAEELRELTFWEVIHPEHLEEQLVLHDELMKGERCYYELEKRYVRKGGEELWSHTRTSLVPAGDGEEPTAIAVMQDISERKLAELALRDNNERLARIAETQRELAAAGVDLASVMQLIAERSMALTKADGAIVNLIEGDELFGGAAAGIAKDAVGKRRKIETSVVRHALAERDTLLIKDTENDPRIDRAMQSKIGDKSHICVPLFHGEQAVAAINVMSRSEDDRLDEQDRQTLELLAVVLASAVSRAAEFEAKRDQLEALARFEATFEGALTGMMLIDLDGRIAESNPAMQEMLGYSATELAGRRVSEFVHPGDVEQARASYLEMVESDEATMRLDHRFVRRDGQVLWANASVAVLNDRDDHKSFAIAMVQDVTQRKEAEDALLAQAELNEYQALHDSLTGLANRTLFRDRIDMALKASKRADTRAAVLLLDLDRFKEINDSLGHAAGDALLVEIAERLSNVLRASDTVARLGGDEFGVLLPDPAVPEDILRAVERVREAIERPITVQELPLAVEASIGIAIYPDDGEDVETLLQRADVAMYHAKEESAGWAFARDTAGRRDPARLTLVGELRRALEERELQLYYQPKATLANGEVNAVEALIRWNHPVRGLVPPADFIPLAQQTGIIKPLTLYVLDEALRQCREWLDDGLRLSIAVNLSTRNLLDVEFPIQIQGLLDRWQVEPALLELEITESTMLADPVRTKLILERLSAMGVRLSIDDFGTGYSSLAYLKRLPVDEIKIDRSFVMNMDQDEDDATIVRSTIDLGRNLGLEVVAEGVETEAIWDQLDNLGCTVAQGYYLSRPVPAEDLRAWVMERRSDAEAPSANARII
jgi:diguanylate cyclase (GGDEF)-like protein/PAS domain S-box-containing protein